MLLPVLLLLCEALQPTCRPACSVGRPPKERGAMPNNKGKAKGKSKGKSKGKGKSKAGAGNAHAADGKRAL